MCNTWTMRLTNVAVAARRIPIVPPAVLLGDPLLQIITGMLASHGVDDEADSDERRPRSRSRRPRSRTRSPRRDAPQGDSYRSVAVLTLTRQGRADTRWRPRPDAYKRDQQRSKHWSGSRPTYVLPSFSSLPTIDLYIAVTLPTFRHPRLMVHGVMSNMIPKG